MNRMTPDEYIAMVWTIRWNINSSITNSWSPGNE